MTPRPIAVVDIDGVVADVSHRLHHLSRTQKDWRSFFAAMDEDALHPEGAALARELATEHDVVYLSGRPEHFRATTTRWLERYGLPTGEVLLRPGNDRRPARYYKVGVLRELARERTIAVVVDDDPLVCTEVRRAGFAVFEATWNRPDDDLLDAQEREGRT